MNLTGVLKIPFTYSIVTNIDKEHLDYYKSFNNLKKNFLKFINNTPSLGKLLFAQMTKIIEKY